MPSEKKNVNSSKQMNVIREICLLMSSNWCHNHPQTRCFQFACIECKRHTVYTEAAIKNGIDWRARRYRQCAAGLGSMWIAKMLAIARFISLSPPLSLAVCVWRPTQNIHNIAFLLVCVCVCVIFHWNHAATCSHVHATRTEPPRLGGKISFAFSCFVCCRCRRLNERKKKRCTHASGLYGHQHWPSAASSTLSLSRLYSIRVAQTRVWRSLPNCNDSTRNMHTKQPQQRKRAKRAEQKSSCDADGERSTLQNNDTGKKKIQRVEKNKCSKTFSQP